jgi:glycosyltransferase involved in cell wall biosynthesis
VMTRTRPLKIGIYNEPVNGSLGGSEYLIGILAHHLAGRYDVELVHHKAGVNSESLAALCGVDFASVRFRHVAYETSPFSRFHPSLSNLRRARDWHADLSAPYDIFICSTHGVPPLCRASAGVLIVLFPFFNLETKWPWNQKVGYLNLRARARRALYDHEWRRRFQSYQKLTAISGYSQAWTKRWWQIDCDVVYPPVDCDFQTAHKSNTIMSVGRFTTQGVVKRQLEMADAFRELEPSLKKEWNYLSAGAVSDEPEDRRYLTQVIERMNGYPARVLPNASREALRAAYASSSIFWHAAGYGDDVARPELAEHFGIVTVEAMAAGCVPVVVNGGAQAEIVEHGVSGFVWNTLDELKDYTTLLASDRARLASMAAAARERASRFTIGHFVQAYEAIVDELALRR